MRVVGCFLQHNDKFVLVHRLPHKIDGDTWGLASGKVEAGESDLQALCRELYEETGYRAHDDEVELLGEYDFTSPRGNTYTYITYRIRLKDFHEVRLEEAAHSEYKWVTIEEAGEKDNLIDGLHNLFRLVGFVK